MKWFFSDRNALFAAGFRALCGLFTADAMAASRANRAATSARPIISFVITLTTTFVSRTRCSAIQTLPMPPCARTRTSRTDGVT